MVLLTTAVNSTGSPKATGWGVDVVTTASTNALVSPLTVTGLADTTVSSEPASRLTLAENTPRSKGAAVGTVKVTCSPGARPLPLKLHDSPPVKALQLKSGSETGPEISYPPPVERKSILNGSEKLPALVLVTVALKSTGAP